MRELSVFLITAVFLMCRPFPAAGETVFLKNGQVVEGKIVEKNDLYIKLISPAFKSPIIYLLTEIESIGPVAEHPQVEESVEQDQDSALEEQPRSNVLEEAVKDDEPVELPRDEISVEETEREVSAD